MVSSQRRTLNNPLSSWQITSGAVALLLMLTSCQAQSPSSPNRPQSNQPLASFAAEDKFATVTAVEVPAGEPGAYTFVVTVESPDTGCDQYANWWEVLTPEGELIFRRILVHSHVDEQPFRRPGGAVDVQPDRLVIVRAHMHPHGYGLQAMQGTVEAGFEEVTLPDGFAANLARVAPQPRGCEY